MLYRNAAGDFVHEEESNKLTMIMQPRDNDGDDPFHHLMAWDADQPSSKEEDEHDDSSSDSDADNRVIVEDASTTDEEGEVEEGSDNNENIGGSDEMKKSFVVEELFPTSVHMAATNENDGGETEAVSTPGHFSPVNPTIDMTVGHDSAEELPASDAKNGPAIEQRGDHFLDSILNATAAELDANEVSNQNHFKADDSALQQQEIIPDATIDAATEAKPLVDNKGVDDRADDLLLSFLDDEAVVSNHHQTDPLQINSWQQEQPPQQHLQDNMLAQKNLLDIPLSSYDHSHSYQPPAESLIETVTDTNIGHTTTDDHLHNPTDETITTATITTAEWTHENENVEDYKATQIPSAYAYEVDAGGSADDRNEVRPTRRDLEVNYAIGKEVTRTSNGTLDEEHHRLGERKTPRKQKYKKRRVKPATVNGFDEEQAVAVLPGMVAYTHLNEQDDDYGHVHSKRSSLKVPSKRRKKRRCVAMLCIVVVVLLAAIVGLLYYVIAAPSVKVSAGNNDSGKMELGEGIEEGGNANDVPGIGGGVSDGHVAPTSDSNHDYLDTPLENGIDPMIDSNDHHFQHDTSSDDTASSASDSSVETELDESQVDINIATSSANHSSVGLDESQVYINITASPANYSSTGTMQDESSVASSNTTDSLLLSNSSALSPANTLLSESTSFASTDLSLTTTTGEALVTGISKSYGIVFDIESLVPSLTVTGMDLYLDTSFSSRYEVWMAQGSWRDGAEFVEIAHGTIDGTGVCHDVHLDNCEFAPIPGDEFDTTTIYAGERKSFWVTLRDDDLVSHNLFVGHEQNNRFVSQQDNLEDADTVYATNTEMNVYYGTAILRYPIQLADPLTDYRSSRGFIGRIRYKVGDASDNLTEPSDVVELTKMPVMPKSETPSAKPSILSTNAPEEPVESCHYVTEESCREAASSLGLHLGGAGWPFAGAYARAGCHFYSCSNCLYGGIAYFGSKGTVADFQSTHSVHSEKRLDCNTNLYSIEDESPFWCFFPTTKCAGC